jgi:hypothetical protein
MANKTASFSASLSWTDGFGKAQTLNPPVSVACKYNGLSEGTWDLAAATMGGATLTLPLGSIAVPTGFIVQNNSDADVQVKINTSGAHTLSPGACLAEFGPQVAAGTTPITEIKLTTETATTLAGSVAYVIFGDPT